MTLVLWVLRLDGVPSLNEEGVNWCLVTVGFNVSAQFGSISSVCLSFYAIG